MINMLWLFTGCGAQNGALPEPESNFRSTALLEKSGVSEGTLAYLNRLRVAVGLHPLKQNRALESSALSHARYLAANNLYTHTQNAADDAFLAETPLLRAVASGYDAQRLLENIYAGDVSGKEAVDILFSDIYHRFAFLDTDVDEIGVAEVASERYRYGRVHTFEMGRAGDVIETGGDAGVVVWPYPGAKAIMPVFYEEAPDPLPDCSVSGYPVSVTFNPRRSEDFTFESLALFDENGFPVEDARLLDAAHDPNHHFEKNMFALMPLRRLGWGKHYRAELVYRDREGKETVKSWEFDTQKLQGDLHEVQEGEERFTVRSGQTSFFYLEPHNCNDRFERYRYRYTPTLKISEKMVDHNTIMLRAEGRGEIEVIPDNGRRFFVSVR